MTEPRPTLLDALEKEAIKQIQEIERYRIYQGDKPVYLHKAKIAIGIIGATVRLAATLENRRSNDLILVKMLPVNEPERMKLLKGA